MAGVSRSVTLVIAYIMEKSGSSYDTAYEYVKSKRKIVIYPLKVDSPELVVYQAAEIT